MIGFSYPPPIFDSATYNSTFYLSLDPTGYLTYAYSQTLYLDKNDYRLSFVSGVSAGIAQSGIALVPDTSLGISGLGALSCSSLTIGGVPVGSSPIITGITNGVGAADKALVLDASRNINNINSLTATTLVGTISTAAQPNITSVGTLSSLKVSSTLSQITFVSSLADAYDASIIKSSGTDGQTASLAFLISANPASLPTGSIVAVRTGLLGVGTMNFLNRGTTMLSYTDTTVSAKNMSLDLSSTGIDSPAYKLSSVAVPMGLLTAVVAGTGAASKALSLNATRDVSNINNLTATKLTGAIQTASQPLITNIGTLGSLTISNTFADALSLVNTSTSTAASISFNNGSFFAAIGLRGSVDGLGAANSLVLRNNSIDSLIIDENGRIAMNGYGIDSSYSMKCGSISCDDIVIAGNSYSFSVLGATAGTASASKALILDSNSKIAGISSIATDYLVVNQPGGIICQATAGFTNMNSALSNSGLIIQGFSNGLSTYSVLSFLTYTNLAYNTTTPSATIGAYRRSTGSYSGADLEFWTKNSATQTVGLFRMGSFGLNVSTGSLSVGPTNGVMDLNVLKGGASPSFRIGAYESSKNSYTMTYTYSSFSSDNNSLSFNTYGTSGTLTLFSNDTVVIGGTSIQPSRFTVIGSSANLSGNWQRCLKVQAGIANPILFEVQVYPETAGTNSNGCAIGTTTNDPLKFMSNNVVGMYLNGSKRLNVDRAAAGPEATIHSGGDVWADAGFHSKQNVDGKAVYRTNWSQSNYLAMGTDATVGAMRLGTCDASYNWVTYAPVRGGSYTNASDRRLKKDVLDIPYGLSEDLRMTPRRYTLKHDSSSHVGFIAQELVDVIPECVSGNETADDDLNEAGEPINPMGVDLASLTAVLCKAIQELNTRIDKLVGNIAT